MDLTQLHSNLTSVIDNLDTLVLEAAMESKETIADLNTSQLEKGLTSENEEIEPYYSPDYGSMKKAMGKRSPGMVPDLKLTGDFYSGVYASLEKDWIEIHSTDYKEAQLRKKYSDDIFGLTEGNLGELGKYMIDDLTNKIRDELTKS